MAALALFFIACAPSVSPASSFAATSQAITLNHTDAFDAVSIRPSREKEDMEFGVSPIGFLAKGTPLSWVILQAYYPREISFWRSAFLQHAPPWVFSDKYDIEARLEPALLPQYQQLDDAARQKLIRPLLRNFLVERCHLQIRLGSTKVTVIMLVRSDGSAENIHPSSSKPGPPTGIPIEDGGFYRPITGNAHARHALEFRNTTMHAFTAVLSGLISDEDYIVEDRTGLSGAFDFLLTKRTPSDSNVAGDKMETVDGLSQWDISSLGLKLKHERAEVPAIRIESISRPESN